jgi:predicted RecB family nuclease
LLFNRHSELRDKHAFLSPSNYHWVNYTDEKLEARYTAAQASRRGTDLHNLAHEAIRLGVKLSKANKAIATYVNDGIGYKMSCEQPLYYSDNCFGHADTIAFRRAKLRIHDLKTGISPTKEKQLEVYAAIFCLEYGISPFDIEIELRIYQGEEVRVYEPYAETIANIMETIVDFDRQIEDMRNSDQI